MSIFDDKFNSTAITDNTLMNYVSYKSHKQQSDMNSFNPIVRRRHGRPLNILLDGYSCQAETGHLLASLRVQKKKKKSILLVFRFFPFPFLKPEGKRPLGRSRRKWEENIQMDVRETGWEVMDWSHLAQDWDQRRAVVNTVMNLRIPKGQEFD
jgi:hypothetical protein